MKKLFLVIGVLGMAAITFSLTGCGVDTHPPYSSDVKYTLREDPIMRSTVTTNELGDERIDPDRPGIFPIMSFADFSNPENPFYPKREDIQKKEWFRDPTKMVPAVRQELETALTTMFGTPAKPIVNAQAAGVTPATIALLKLDNATLEKGSTRYRVHCLHCHGVTGDGRGPTARWINPHPRDFRAGKFKFQSVNQSDGTIDQPPARSDLMRTLRSGIEGSAMPSFNLLHDDELEAIISYVIHLSLRGKVESNIILSKYMSWNDKTGALTWNEEKEADDDTGKLITITDEVTKTTTMALTRKDTSWANSQDPARAIQPAPYPYKAGDMKELLASLKRGQQFFTANPSQEFIKEYRDRLIAREIDKRTNGKKPAPAELDSLRTEIEKTQGEQLATTAKNTITGVKCVTCHADYGRQAKYRFDSWGTLVRPNNFTLGVFRGGRRPVDIYYRIHSGINGSGMTPFGSTLQGQDIWDLVNFVSNLAYPGMRREMREKLQIDID